jgi:hypothetical protein
MTPSFDFTKLRRLITIYAVVQVVLVLLLIYVALYFQAAEPHRFLKSVAITFILQLTLFYPINKFATAQASREVETCNPDLTPDELKAFRKKRMIGDMVKMAVIIFFSTFIFKMPSNPKFLLGILFYTFILTILSYFQCFNFAARRLMREKG